MLDKRTELMLQVADTLTAEDIAYLRGVEPPQDSKVVPDLALAKRSAACVPKARANATEDVTRGERERLRTRESKISTSCVGQRRTGHEWWPVGTELVGRMRDQVFTAEVVENPSVKSNRSLLITSGPAQSTICITPTRAAIEATEGYRQAHDLGRGGGVTNGWTFWQPKQSAS